MEEAINKMKLCWFCRDSEDWPYTENAAKHHQERAMHMTKGTTWQPMKGHPQYELHLKWCKLLDLTIK